MSSLVTTISLDQQGIVVSITCEYANVLGNCHVDTVIYRQTPFPVMERNCVEVKFFRLIAEPAALLAAVDQSPTVVSLLAPPSADYLDNAYQDFPELALVDTKRVTSSLQQGETLASELLAGSISESSRRQYGYAFKKWEKFAADNKLNSLPAEPKFVIACVALAASESQSVSAADTLAASISYQHQKNMLPTPTCHPSFKLLMRSIRRKYSKPPNPATPMTVQILHKMLDHLYDEKRHGHNGLGAPLSLWRTIWRLVFEFYTLGRWSDVVALQRRHLTFVGKPVPHLLVTFPPGAGKNDVKNQGSERLVSSNLDVQHCPIRLTRLYLRRLGAAYQDPSYQGYMVSRIRGLPKGQQVA